jgi:hypothetical protein
MDNCGVTDPICEPPSGTIFSAGTAVVHCQAVDTAGSTSECSFAVSVSAAQVVVLNKCPLGKGDWKNHHATWPATELSLGGQVYSATELLALLKLPAKGDASVILASQLIAAKLNRANGSDPTPVADSIAQADQLLSGAPTKLPYKIAPSTVLGQAMVTVAGGLDAYNSGSLTPNCVP